MRGERRSWDLDHDDDGRLIIERATTSRDPDEVAARALQVTEDRIVTTGGRQIAAMA